MANLFDVDVRGLQQTLAADAPRILMEPIANALDTNATEITVEFSWFRGVAKYTVSDNDPQGFARLSDAFTMFAPSERKGVATARGRFGFGEKEFVALSYPGPVSIRTTSGTVTFAGDTRTVRKGYTARRSIGSAVTAHVRLPRAQAEEFVGRLRGLLVPDGVQLQLAIDGEICALAARPALRTIEVTLPTVVADEQGILRPTRRQTVVTLHEVGPGETPTLYELGVPVVAHHGQWHLNVAQKVPLARSRDAVTPSYLRAVHLAALEAAADLLTPEMAKGDWVLGGLPDATPETVRAVVHLVHGQNAVIADPSCPEATKRAIDAGRPVVHGGAYPAEVWARIKAANVLRPAGQYQELRGDVPASSDGVPPIPESEWQVTWRAVARYASELCLELTGQPITVEMFDMPWASWAACCGRRAELGFNVGLLPESWWTDERAVDELLIHEFAHLRVGDHLSDAFHTECCRLGARLRTCRTQLDTYAPKDVVAA